MTGPATEALRKGEMPPGHGQCIDQLVVMLGLDPSTPVLLARYTKRRAHKAQEDAVLASEQTSLSACHRHLLRRAQRRRCIAIDSGADLANGKSDGQLRTSRGLCGGAYQRA